MKVTIKYNEPIGNFKAVGRTETFTATSFFESGSLIYFKVDRFNYKTVSKSEIVSIEK
jgi:hypothetical protein